MRQKKKEVNLCLPIDSINADDFDNRANTNISSIFSINEKYMGLDIGGKSIAKFCDVIKNSKTIIWNGPMGVFEMKKFEKGTKKIGEAVCLATEKNAFSLVGGGDSIAALQKFNLESRVSYISTGGGAMLEYIEGRRLPGVVAIMG
jgi:phosphoglycerate kinase